MFHADMYKDWRRFKGMTRRQSRITLKKSFDYRQEKAANRTVTEKLATEYRPTIIHTWS